MDSVICTYIGHNTLCPIITVCMQRCSVSCGRKCNAYESTNTPVSVTHSSIRVTQCVIFSNEATSRETGWLFFIDIGLIFIFSN